MSKARKARRDIQFGRVQTEAPIEIKNPVEIRATKLCSTNTWWSTITSEEALERKMEVLQKEFSYTQVDCLYPFYPLATTEQPWPYPITH